MAAALAGLDQDCLLVAQSVVVLGDGTDVSRLRAFVRCGAADLDGGTGGQSGDLLDAALGRLRDLALVWPGERPGTLRVTVALQRHWKHPLALGPRAAVILDRLTKEPIRQIAERLGAVKGATRDAAIANVQRAVADHDAIRTRAASASPAAQELLGRLARDPAPVPPPHHTWDDRYHGYGHRTERPLEPAEELRQLGLLFTGSDHDTGTLPREIALAVRGPLGGPQLTGPPAVPALPAGTPAAAAAPVVLASLGALHAVLDAVAAAPLVPVKTGGFGRRDLHRLARETGRPAQLLPLWLELGIRAGLLGPDIDRSYQPTHWHSRWQALEPCAHWAQLAGAWWRSADGPAADAPLERMAAPVLGSLAAPGTGLLRRALVTILAGLPEGRAVDGSGIGTRLAWQVPAVPGAAARAGDILAESEALGITVAGRLTPVGRALARSPQEIEAAAGALLPAPVAVIALQSDLTAVAAGPVPAAIAQTLDTAADREGTGVWRFSRASVRRALDTGRTHDEVTTALAGITATGLPNVLTQLIADVARVHGALRVSGCGCALVATEESLLAEVLAARPDLHRLAPTVAVGPGSPHDLLRDLRDLGYAPVTDPLTGAAQVNAPPAAASPRSHPTGKTTRKTTGKTTRKAPGRGTAGPASAPEGEPEGAERGLALFHPPGLLHPYHAPGDLAAQLCAARPGPEQRLDEAITRLTTWDNGFEGVTRLPPDQIRLLAQAQEEGFTVLVEQHRSLTSSLTDLYLLDEVRLGHTTIDAWNPRWDSPAEFRLVDLVSVERA